MGGGQTRVNLALEYEPEGLMENVADKLNMVENRAEGDLERFKSFIKSEGEATGDWRGASMSALTWVRRMSMTRLSRVVTAVRLTGRPRPQLARPSWPSQTYAKSPLT